VTERAIVPPSKLQHGSGVIVTRGQEWGKGTLPNFQIFGLI
jgi:hypothetical protein